MDWLTEDPSVLDFVLDIMETPTASTVLDTSDTSQTSSEKEELLKPVKTKTKTKAPAMVKPKKPRHQRREEIAALKKQADELQGHLDRLRLDGEMHRLPAHAVADWICQARREQSARRQSEMKNLWLKARLAHYVKLSQKLARTTKRDLHQLASKPALPRVDAVSEAAQNATTRILEGPLPGVTSVEVDATWSFHGYALASVEAALWALFSADRMVVTRFSVDYEIVAVDTSSVHSSFTIQSSDNVQFQGSQIARWEREENTGEFLVVALAQTHPHGDVSRLHGAAVADAALLDEHTTFRTKQIDPSNTGTSIDIQIQRQLHLHAASLTVTERQEIARFIIVHMEEEMAWMQEEIQHHAANSKF